MDSTVLVSDLVCIVFSSDTANKCFRASWTPLYTPCKHGQLFVLHCTADYYPAPACHKFRKSERLWTESPTCWSSYRSKSNGNALVRSMLPKSNDVRKQSAPEIKKWWHILFCLFFRAKCWEQRHFGRFVVHTLCLAQLFYCTVQLR